MINAKVKELTEWVNWNYMGLIAAVLSVIVTSYNISRYWEEIKKEQKG
jgi:hypothetical protein